MVWIKREGDAVLLSSAAGRQKVRNVQRDPRVSRSVFDLANPYTSVEIRGTAEILPDEGNAFRVSSRTRTSASTLRRRRATRAA